MNSSSAQTKSQNFSIAHLIVGGIVLIIFSMMIGWSIPTLAMRGNVSSHSPAQPTPLSSPETIHRIFDHYMRIYYGLETWYGEFGAPQFDPQTQHWTINITYVDAKNITRTVVGTIDDRTHAIRSLFISMPVLTVPENLVVLPTKECNTTLRPLLIHFVDPYDPYSIWLENRTIRIAQRYDAHLVHRFIRTRSDAIATQYPRAPIHAAFRYAKCHELHGLYQNFTDCFVSTYIENGRPLSEKELAGCSLLDQQTLTECFTTVDERLREDYAFAETYLSTPLSTPNTVINCKYVVAANPSLVERTLCYLYNFSRCW